MPRATLLAWMVVRPVSVIAMSPLRLVKVGMPVALASSSWPEVPAAVAWTVPAPLPYRTPLLVKVVVPVPPLLTLKADVRVSELKVTSSVV